MDPKNVEFPVGTPVRILSKKRGAFAKGSAPTFSSEPFKIRAIRPTQPITYLLSDFEEEAVIEPFYARELVHAEPGYLEHRRVKKIHRKKGRQVEVSFERIPERMKQWVKQSELKKFRGPIH